MNNQLIHATNYELAITQRDFARAEREKVTAERDGALSAAASHLRTVEQQAKIIAGNADKALAAEALAVFDLMLVGCSLPCFGDYQNGDGETIGPRMDALHGALKAARPAAAPQQAVSVPEGWQLVPCEPTPKMIDATFNHLPLDGESHNRRNKRIYAAMLAAAPTPPAAPPAPTLTDDEILRLYFASEPKDVFAKTHTWVKNFARAIAAHLTTAVPAAKGES